MSEDFNYIQEIQRAHMMHYPKSAELILTNFKKSFGSEKYVNAYTNLIVEMLPILM